MPLVKVAATRHLTPGELTEVRHNGNPYAVCNVAGEYFAVEGRCPHAGGPLGHGALHDHMIVCPYHAWEFDCRTGENDFDPTVRVQTIPTVVHDGTVYIDISAELGPNA